MFAVLVIVLVALVALVRVALSHASVAACVAGSLVVLTHPVAVMALVALLVTVCVAGCVAVIVRSLRASQGRVLLVSGGRS